MAEFLLQEFNNTDANADGLISFEEAQSILPGVNQSQFNEIDKDGDGMLSKEELEAFLKKKCGCGGGKSLSPAEQVKRLVSDWLLIGLSMLVLLGFAGAQKRM